MARLNRYRIDEIELDPPTSTHRVGLTLWIEGKMVPCLPKEKKRKKEPLRWKDIKFDALPNSKLSLEILEAPFKLKSQDLEVSLLNAQEVAPLRFDYVGTTGNVQWSAKIKPLGAEGVERSLSKALEDLTQSLNSSSTPTPTRRLEGIILGFASVVSKIHPSVEAAMLGLVEVMKALAEQDQWNEDIRSLVSSLVGMMESVQEVAKNTDMDPLKGVIENMMTLLEDVSAYVTEHGSRGATAFKHRGAIETLDHIKVFSNRFDRLKTEFIAGVGVETHKTMQDLILQNFLNRLQKVDSSGYDCDHVCQRGTREDVIDKVLGLIIHQKSLWIRGPAGIGKSSVAASVCKYLDNSRMLAASFFCKRDDDALRNPLRLIDSIAYGLAARCPEYKKSVANAIRDNMGLCNSHLDQRFEGLIQKPLQELWYLCVPPLVIVIDALDECGTPDSRRKLLGHLVDLSRLVPWLRVIVTSRPALEIQNFFHNISQNVIPTSLIDLQGFDASADIRAFIERKLLGTSKKYNWPKEGIDQLCERAGGLFIWAAIATRHILGAVGSTKGRLSEVLGDQPSAVSEDLGKLYTNILSGISGAGDDNKALVRQCIGAIFMASTRQPLPISSLSNLLEDIKGPDLDAVVGKLGSILYLDAQLGGAVRFYHPSFADYLTDPLCSQDFHVNVDQLNWSFARGCLNVIESKTSFNICELETSYLPNSQVQELPDRIDTKIPKYVRYSCLHWISHVVDCPPEMLRNKLQDVTTGLRLIFWLEVLSLIERVDIALMDLPRLIMWLPDELESSARIIQEFYRFVSVFHDAIATSTPHLYISALAFCPKTSSIYQALDQHFSGRITIREGADKDWPRWLRVITHPTHVKSLAVDPMGQVLATGCYDGTIRLWSLISGIPIGDPLSKHSEPVTSLEFSHDGARLVSGSIDASVRVWNIQASSPAGHEGPSVNHCGAVTSVAFSSKGTQIISGSSDGTIRISSAETGEPIDPTRVLVVFHPEEIKSVAISPDDTQIAYSSGYLENKAMLQDLASGEEQPLVGHSGEVTSIAFSHDGAYVITGSVDMTVRLWRSKTGEPLGQPFVGHSGFLTAVAFSPDGNSIVSSCNDRVIRVFNTRDNKLISSSLTGHSGAVTCVSFTPSGAQIVSGSRDETLRIWSMENNSVSGSQSFSRFVSIIRSLISAHPRAVAAVLNSKSMATGHAGGVSTVAFSPDGLSIVSGSSDRSTRVWDVKTGNPTCGPIKHGHAVDCLAISPDGKRVATGCGTRIRVWNTNESSPDAALLTEQLAIMTTVLALLFLHYHAFRPHDRISIHNNPRLDGPNTSKTDDRSASCLRFFIPYICSISLVYSVRMVLSRSEIQHPVSVSCVHFSSDGGRLFCGSRDGAIHAYDPGNGKLIGTSLLNSSGHIIAITNTSNEERIVSSSNDGTVRVWDIIKGKPTNISFRDYPDEGMASTTAFDPTGDVVAFGFLDNSIRCFGYDAETGTGGPICDNLVGHSDIVRSIAFSPMHDLIASGSDDTTVRIWNFQTNSPHGNPLIGHYGPVKSVSFSPSGSQIVSGSADGTIRVWSVNHPSMPPESFEPKYIILEPLPHGPNGSFLVTHPGWYSHDKESLLFWLPDHYRRAYDPRALLCISTNPSDILQVDFSKFAHGKNWASVYHG